MPSTRALARSPWSASKVQTALRCPRLFHFRYVEKRPEPEVMPETKVGKAAHEALEHALQGMMLPLAIEKGAGHLETDEEIGRYESLCARIPEFLRRLERFRQRHRVSRTLVEYSLALDQSLAATSFFSPAAYYRGIVDLAYLFGDGDLAVIDHKSGQRHPHLSIGDQLEGYAVLAAAGFRRVRRVWLGVHWLGSGDVDWAPPMSVAEINQRILPEVVDTIEAAALAVDDGPRPQTSTWCLRCSYRSICPAGREVRFEPVDDEPPLGE